MFTRMCEVQIDAVQFEHFKHTWGALSGTPRLASLRNALKRKLRNRDIFIKFSLFDSKRFRIFDNDNRYLKANDQFSLKTKDGQHFYAQAISNNANAQILKELQEEQKKMSNNIERQRELRRKQTIDNQQLQQHLEAQMKEEYSKMMQEYNKLNHKINENDVEQYYVMIKTQKCKFDEKTDCIKKIYARFQKLFMRLKIEYDRLQSCHGEVRANPNIKSIVLLGKTGDGKSTFGNRICGDKSKLGNKGSFKATNNTISVTKKIQKTIVELNGTKIAVVDTPGIFDSDEADYQNAIDLVQYLKGCGGVNTFIVIGKPPRLDMSFQQMLKNLHDMLGKEFWHHLIFVITHLPINMSEQHDEEKKNEQDDDDDDVISIGSDEELEPDEWLNDFAMRVRGKLSLPKKPICIGVENRDTNSYKSAIENLLEKISNKKFDCKRLTSLFDKDKIKCQALYDELQTQIGFRREIRDAMLYIEERIDKQVSELQNKDPNYRPSFQQLNVTKLTRSQVISFNNLSIIDRHKNVAVMEHVYMEMDFEEKDADRQFVVNNIALQPNIVDMDLEQPNDYDELPVFPHYNNQNVAVNNPTDEHFIMANNMENKPAIQNLNNCNHQNNALPYPSPYPLPIAINYEHQVNEAKPLQNVLGESLPLCIFGEAAVKFMCEVCSNVPLQIAACNKGHTFCRKCLLKLSKNNEKCPVDKAEITDVTIEVFILDQIIKKENICCIHSAEAQSEGGWTGQQSMCRWKGIVADLGTHLDQCKFKPKSLEEYLIELGFGQYINNFKKNEFHELNDLKEMADDMTQDDLKEIGILPMLHRKKLLKAIKELNKEPVKNNENAYLKSNEEGSNTQFM